MAGVNNRKIELLAPAGSFEGLIGAINGGADAVYLAGDRFGARAYANNFSREEICEALILAKLHNVKIYLTVNTLLKNVELNELFEYMKPLYDNGLDGVIVQDIGVFTCLKEWFPGLELHVSTQMTVTSLEGAKFLTDLGAKRVVLSRELTLDEVKNIVDAGIETECFVHGSMCYCYSGQCLFSSVIGQRSGNRGRCAQPCRLPYKVNGNKKEEYCLSLKDMCTLEHLPELIESGIASFKIEGRMKNPAYAAWVTKIYRKYIDRYLANPSQPFKVEKRDLEQLKTLYIRSELHDGYYHKYRGGNMITKDSPAYSKTDEKFVSLITEEMIKTMPKKEILMRGKFRVGEPCELVVSLANNEDLTVTVTGDVVQEAQKAPITQDALAERLGKMGDSYFCVKNPVLDMDDNIFMPVKAINELRRQALELLLENVKNKMCMLPDRKAACQDELLAPSTDFKNKFESAQYIAFVETKEQWKEVLEAEYIKRIVIPYGWLLDDCKAVDVLQEESGEKQKEIFFALPAVCRNAMTKRIKQAFEVAVERKFGVGFYANQFDSLSLVKRYCKEMQCNGDLHLYCFNNVSANTLKNYVYNYTISVELNKDEIRHLNAQNELVLYGRLPLMETANCIFMTENMCRKQQKDVGKAHKTGSLKDRTGTNFCYRTHCDEPVCYNTIYNSVPVSLHKHKAVIDKLSCCNYQLRFTVENAAETRNVLRLFQNFSKGEWMDDVSYAYTNGHFMRGVQ